MKREAEFNGSSHLKIAGACAHLRGTTCIGGLRMEDLTGDRKNADLNMLFRQTNLSQNSELKALP